VTANVQCPIATGVIVYVAALLPFVAVAMPVHESALPEAGVVNVNVPVKPDWVTVTFIAKAAPIPSNETLPGLTTTPEATGVAVGVGTGEGPVRIGATGTDELELQPASAVNA
jgi:hypothetical protein